MTATKGTPELIGRSTELSAVLRALADSDQAGCVLVGIEGVGKSLVARHALAAVAANGDDVAHVIATRSAAMMPYGPLRSLLRPDEAAGGPVARPRLATDPDHRLVVLVDDAHLLDDASAALLLEASADPTVSILYTVCANESLPDAVTALWKDRGAARIEIEPLDTVGVAEMIVELIGGDVPEWIARRFERLSSGRPLEVRERVRAALDDGRLVGVDGRWELIGEPPIPASLVEIVTARLGHLDDASIELLEVLASCAPVPLSLVDRLGLAHALDELEDAGLVGVADHGRSHGAGIVPERGDDPGMTVHIEHPVHHRAVDARLTERRRRQLYRRVAEASEALGDAGGRSTLWRLRAGDRVDAERLVAAARGCFRDGNYAHCGELAGAAWRQEPSFAAGQLYGYALGEAGRCGEAELVLAAAEQATADDRELALITLTRSENLLRGLGDPDGADALCRAAEARLQDRHWRSELLAHRTMGTLRSGRIDEAVSVLETLLDAAVHGKRAYVTAAYTAGIACIHAGRADDASAIALEAMPIHESLWSADQLTEPGVHHITTLFALVATGRAAEALPLLEFARDLTRYVVPRYGYAWMNYLAGRAALRLGRCDDAAGYFLEAVPIFGESRREEEAAWCEAGVAVAAALQGDTARSRVHLDASQSLHVTSDRLNAALTAEAQGWLAVAEGASAEGRARFRAGADDALAVGDRLGASHLLSALARTGGAVEALDDLERLAATVQGDLIGVQLAVARALAGPDDVDTLLATALDCEQRGLLLESAELAASAARALRRAGRAQAAARAAAVGRDRLGRCQRVRTPLLVDLSTTVPLTAREVDVARLAADRRSSKEIAQQLGIAKRTVDNHLRNVYRKLDISGRADLSGALGIGTGASSSRRD